MIIVPSFFLVYFSAQGWLIVVWFIIVYILLGCQIQKILGVQMTPETLLLCTKKVIQGTQGQTTKTWIAYKCLCKVQSSHAIGGGEGLYAMTWTND